VKTQDTEAKVDQWDHSKLQSFCTAKETMTRAKSKPTERDEVCTNYSSDRLISRIEKELNNTSKISNNLG
jgi:hypothetical protein